MLHSIRLLAAVVTLSLLGGCAASTVRLNGSGPAGGATLTLPEPLEIATINGVEPKGVQGLLRGGERTLQLAPGRYDILAYYREIWTVGEGHDTLMSDPARFLIDVAEGQHYRLDYHQPQNYEAARTLERHFEGWVTDLQTQQRTPSSDSGLRFRRGLTGKDKTLIAATPADHGDGATQFIAPLPAATAAPAPERAITAPAGTASKSQDWLSLMQAWWQQANAEERRAFLAWVAAAR
jgi:uncharacterized protein YccT (UPF0319 family)